MAGALTRALRAGVAQGLAPAAVAGWADRGGVREVAAEGEAPDAMFRLHSLTKLVGGVCAAILAEEGRLDLDAPAARLVPDLGQVLVLDGFDGDRPALRPPATPVTARQLATHTSGSVYPVWWAPMLTWAEATGARRAALGVRAGLAAQPLAFDPGAAWAYGEGIDWLGLIVEAAAGQRIDAFCAERVFGPLGMADTVFAPDPPRAARLARAWTATPGGFAPKDLPPPAPPDMWCMGHALHGTVPDYLRLLRAILGGGVLDGARVMGQGAVRLLLEDQIAPLRAGPMRSAMPRRSQDVDLFPGRALGHSLAGPVLLEDAPGRRCAGAVGWAGVMNCWWWLDPARGVCGVLMTQVLPLAEPRALALLDACERAVFAAAPLAASPEML